MSRHRAVLARTVTAATLAALTVGLAGCSAGDGGGAGASPSPSPTSPTSTSPSSAPSATAKQPGVVPSKVPNRPGKRDRVRLTGCQAGDGGWTASGTARAGKGGDAHYRITVFFTTGRATVVGWGRTTVDVPAGQSHDWSVTTELPAKGDLLCVLRGVG